MADAVRQGHIIVSFSPIANLEIRTTVYMAKQRTAELNSRSKNKKLVAFYIANPVSLEHLSRPQLTELEQMLRGGINPLPGGTSTEDLLAKTWSQVSKYALPDASPAARLGSHSQAVKREDSIMAKAAATKAEAPAKAAPKAAKAAPAAATEAPAKEAKAPKEPAAPRERALMAIEPQAEKIRPVKESAMTAWLINKMNRKSGVSETEVQAELDERGLANPPRTWIASDLCRTIGYGATEKRSAAGVSTYFLVVPEGVEIPAHKKTVSKPVAAEA